MSHHDKFQKEFDDITFEPYDTELMLKKSRLRS